MFGSTRVLSIVAVVTSLAGAALGQTLRTEQVTPQSTDPAITGWLSPHFAALATDRPHRGLLFLYMHGQGGNGSGATELVKTAAEEGFHAVGVTYACDWSPFTLCQGSGDPDCPEKVRRETLEGADYSPFVSVSMPNSLENRLRKLLTFLDNAHPGEGWGAYVVKGQIQWGSIVVWGHSMGGGNVGVLARLHTLARVCMSAPAADGGPGSPAAWWAVHATPASSYYGFCHTQDQLSTKVAFWNAIGMGTFGAVVDVASASPPYAGTHELSTSVEPAVSGQYHNSVVADGVTPRLPDGSPVYKVTWRHMMTGGLSGACFANCDASSGSPVLTANDFQCFLNRFAANDPWANCDGSSGIPTLTSNDFQCFLNAFAAGCS